MYSKTFVRIVSTDRCIIYRMLVQLVCIKTAIVEVQSIRPGVHPLYEYLNKLCATKLRQPYLAGTHAFVTSYPALASNVAIRLVKFKYKGGSISFHSSILLNSLS